MVGRIVGPLFAVLVTASGTLQQSPSASEAKASLVRSGTQGGAPYRIDIPADWNGNLVVYFHGYEASGTPRVASWPKNPLTDIFLNRGFAVAQSGYSKQGWAEEEGRSESEKLRQYFAQEFSKPRRTYAVGQSLGGHIVLSSLEKYPQSYDGGLSLCGANEPARILFSTWLDELVVADALFPGLLPHGPRDLAHSASPPMLDPSVIERIAARLKQRPDEAALLSKLTGFELADVPKSVFIAYSGLREMIERAGGFPLDNRRTDYELPLGRETRLNRRVYRFSANPAAARYLDSHANLNGRIQDPLVLLSNEYDDMIPVRLNALYPNLVRAAGRQRWVLQMPPRGRGHCHFRGDQIGQAFDKLIAMRRR